MNKLDLIADALSGPRGSGRTYRMIAGAPKGATVLVHSKQHANFILEEARSQGRTDLGTLAVIDADHIVGTHRNGSFVADHYSLEMWLRAAAREVEVLKGKLARTEDKLTVANEDMAALKAENELLKARTQRLQQQRRRFR